MRVEGNKLVDERGDVKAICPSAGAAEALLADYLKIKAGWVTVNGYWYNPSEIYKHARHSSVP